MLVEADWAAKHVVRGNLTAKHAGRDELDS